MSGSSGDFVHPDARLTWRWNHHPLNVHLNSVRSHLELFSKGSTYGSLCADVRDNQGQLAKPTHHEFYHFEEPSVEGVSWEVRYFHDVIQLRIPRAVATLLRSGLNPARVIVFPGIQSCKTLHMIVIK